MSNESNLYPIGYIEYAFKMYVSYDQAISCTLGQRNVRELVLKKLNPSNTLDPEWRMTVHFGNVQSVTELDEAGKAIKDEVFDMLAFILNTKISEITFNDQGLIPRPGEGPIIVRNLSSYGVNGIRIIIGRVYKTEFRGSSKNVCSKLSDNSIQRLQRALATKAHTRPNLLIQMFRHAIDSEQAVVQFLTLYHILDVLYVDQVEIDKQIRSIEPDTLLSINSQTKQPETVYTRLRNEVNHRIVCPRNTEHEINNNLDLFRAKVHKILQTTLDLEGTTTPVTSLYA